MSTEHRPGKDFGFWSAGIGGLLGTLAAHLILAHTMEPRRSVSTTSGNVTTQPVFAPTDTAALSLLDGNLTITNYGWIHANIHNGTRRRIEAVVVRVVIRNAKNEKVLERTHRLLAHDKGLPLSTTEYKQQFDRAMQAGEQLEWSIVSAEWSRAG